MNNNSVTIQNGNRSVEVSITGSTTWHKGDMHRKYFEVSHSDKKRIIISKLYEVISGGTRDETVEVNGRVFAFELVNCLSSTKRTEARAGVLALVSSL